MHQEMRVVAFTPYGRKRTVSILLEYMRREHAVGVLDEWMLCLNTDPEQEEDIKYAHELAEQHDWIKLYDRPGPHNFRDRMPREWAGGYEYPKQLNTGRFYWYMQDRNTVYLRFDDDIVWVHPRTMRILVEAQVNHPEWLGVFPLIINNAVCSSIMQQRGRIPMEWGHVQPNAVDAIGWGSPEFAMKLHGRFLDHLEQGEEDAMLIPGLETPLGWRQQFSVSCFGIDGGEFADLNGVIDWNEEEHWLTMHRTGVIHKSNFVLGDAQVAHFSFFTQKVHLSRTNLLERYRAVAEKVRAEVDA